MAQVLLLQFQKGRKKRALCRVITAFQIQPAIVFQSFAGEKRGRELAGVIS